MSSSRRGDIYILPTYIAFLMDKINKIYDAWDYGDPELALSRTLRLCYFLPKQLKEKLWSEKEQIEKELRSITGDSSLGWFSSQLQVNKERRNVAMQYLPTFLDKVVDLLDEREYLEKPQITRLRKEHFKEFEDEGQMD